MKKQTETFESLIKAMEYRYDLRTVFDDFLTLTLCAFSQNPLTGVSHDEDLYMATIAKYKDDELRHNIPKMLACLTLEMEAQMDSGEGNDVLGSFYEKNLYRKGASQYFTPWPVCMFMAQIAHSDELDEPNKERKRILDTSCGSGRLLMTGSIVQGKQHEYYGIDTDHTCVKMTVLNLFLNGVFHGEVMCADALRNDDFRGSYKLSFLPFGIFRITEKEKSRLWYAHVSGFTSIKKPDFGNEKWQSEEKSNDIDNSGASQLHLF
jgi:type I restriction-modification system DNA methylase subunit